MSVQATLVKTMVLASMAPTDSRVIVPPSGPGPGVRPHNKVNTAKINFMKGLWR